MEFDLTCIGGVRRGFNVKGAEGGIGWRGCVAVCAECERSREMDNGWFYYDGKWFHFIVSDGKMYINGLQVAFLPISMWRRANG